MERHELEVRVHEDLTLNVGSWVEVEQKGGEVWRRVEAPGRTLFDQVLDSLLAQPPEPESAEPCPADEAAAMAAVCLRWGSYLAVLMDRDKPLWRAADMPGVSRIAENVQFLTPHLEAMGARECSRREYLQRLALVRNKPVELAAPLLALA